MAGRRTGENWLSAKGVAAAKDGIHADGGGLYLCVRGTARSWILRYQLHGKRREMGLGPLSVYGLADARRRRDEARRLLTQGIDPIAARRAAQAVSGRTWGEAVADYITAHESGWRNPSQAQQWRQSLADYGPDASLPVTAVDTALVVRCLREVWTTKTETATRVRGRIERVWDAERVAGTVTGENPARWKGHLSALLPKPSKVARKAHFPAMPYADAPAFYRSLCERDSLTRKALRFTILTAKRTGEVIGAKWSEFDLEGATWTIPAERMKGGVRHVEPLTDAALAILRTLPRNKPPFPLSNNAMLGLLRKKPPKGYGLPFTVHGFRSTFRDWAAETTHHANEVVEMALSHAIKDKAEAAYRRGGLVDKRRTLMADWARYLIG